MKNKLVFVTNFTDENSGGGRVLTNHISTLLKLDKNFEITIIGPDFKNKTYDKLTEGNLVSRLSYKINFLKRSLLGKLFFSPICIIGFITKARPLLKKVINKNTIVHNIEYGTTYPTITTVQFTTLGYLKELISHFSLKKIPWILAPSNPIKILIEFLTFRRAWFCIAISNLIQKDLSELYGIPTKKIKIIRYGVDLTRFNPINKKNFKHLKKEIGIENHFTILWVGTDAERKGLYTLLEAFKKVNKIYPNTTLLICGLEGKNIKKSIIYLGNQEQIEKYYAISDIFVFPTKYEPFGLVTLEAMASGLVPITTNSTSNGCAEILEDGKDSIILKDPTDVKELASKIRFCIENPVNIDTMSKNARKKAEKYSWKNMTKKYIALYKEVSK